MSKSARPIGYYVHHHGSGHAQRAGQLARLLQSPLHILTSAVHRFAGDDSTDRLIALPDDLDGQGRPAAHEPPAHLHYAPLGLSGLRQRMAAIAAWNAREQPALLVVDLSAEITQFARLLGLPAVAVRLQGRRDDQPHLLAYRSCEAVLAPFPAAFEDEWTPDWLREKTWYTGLFSRFDHRRVDVASARAACGFREGRQTVVLINGQGGESFAADEMERCAGAWPDLDWIVLGSLRGEATQFRENLRLIGFVDDPFPWLRAADVIVGSAGTNTVMEIAASGRPFICLPQPRPFDEQLYKARSLQRLGLAAVCEHKPEPEEWGALLQAALPQQPDRWDGYRGPGPAAVAERLDALARYWSDRMEVRTDPYSGALRSSPGPAVSARRGDP